MSSSCIILAGMVIVEVKTMSVLEILATKLIGLNGKGCVHVTLQATIGVVVRHLLYTTVLTHHRTVATQVVAAVVMILLTHQDWSGHVLDRNREVSTVEQIA